MKTVVIIQARMGSTRLPGKVLMDLGGRPVLAHVVDRCRQSGFPVVVATTTNQEDDAIQEWCDTYSVDCFRGTVDPLERIVRCAESHGADCIVRVCGDSPLVNPDAIELIAMRVHAGADYSAWKLTNGKPAILTKMGLTCEAASLWCLQKEHNDYATPQEREHVTKGIYSSPRPWSIHWEVMPHAGCNAAIDTMEDLIAARQACEVPA